jgi:hypothetical protein
LRAVCVLANQCRQAGCAWRGFRWSSVYRLIRPVQ